MFRVLDCNVCLKLIKVNDSVRLRKVLVVRKSIRDIRLVIIVVKKIGLCLMVFVNFLNGSFMVIVVREYILNKSEI